VVNGVRPLAEIVAFKAPAPLARGLTPLQGYAHAQ